MYRADVINAAMEEQGETNESLAHAAGLSHATISAIRNGRSVTTGTLEKVINALRLKPAEVFEPKQEAEAVAA